MEKCSKVMKGNKFYYKNIFMYSSLQFIGNIEEYFSRHTEKLVVFVLMPRTQYDSSFIRVYKMGNLVEENKLVLSKNIFVYYLLWYSIYLKLIFSKFSFNEEFVVISFHPISFFGGSVQRIFRKVKFVFWDGDFFPPVNISLKLFEVLKKYYNGKVDYACYLGDEINKKMNGRVINSPKKKTIMWGVLPKGIRRSAKGKFSALFVGVIKESQGLEFIFDFLKNNKDFSVSIIGSCDKALYKRYKKIIKKNNISKQVFFPNKFFSDEELERISKKCHVGIALYDTDTSSATYYTDPGKVKTYASLGLPLIMTDVSAVAPYVKKMRNGIVINKNEKEFAHALFKIKNEYPKYIKGVKKFNEHFNYEKYYKKSFVFLERP